MEKKDELIMRSFHFLKSAKICRFHKHIKELNSQNSHAGEALIRANVPLVFDILRYMLIPC